MSDFESLTTPRRVEDHRFEWAVPEGWQQGRGAFGGLVIAAMVRAIEAEVGASERALRSLTVAIPGATVLGPARIDVEVLRGGSGQSTVAARLTQEEGAARELRAHAVAVLAKDRGVGEGHVELIAPSMPDWRSVVPVPVERFAPPFARAFEYRAVGALPFTASESARAEGFVRMKEPGARADAAWAAAMLDAWWPALFTRASGPRPMGTVAFTMQIAHDLDAIDPRGAFAYRAWAPVSHGGWVLETRELWTESGALVATNQQTFAIIK